MNNLPDLSEEKSALAAARLFPAKAFLPVRRVRLNPKGHMAAPGADYCYGGSVKFAGDHIVDLDVSGFVGPAAIRALALKASDSDATALSLEVLETAGSCIVFSLEGKGIAVLTFETDSGRRWTGRFGL